MYDINMTVADLKAVLSTLPDDMGVVIPVADIDDANTIHAFRRIRTAGILECPGGNPDQVLSLNPAADGLDISSQINGPGYHADSSVTCIKVLF